MTTDSQFYDRSRLQIPQNWADGMAKHTNESTGAMDDMVKRDRFELLSAYLDGEVTAAERRQVEAWLANDASVKCLYARLLKLRQGLQAMPVPASEQPLERTVQQVMTRLRRRSQLAWAFGGAAVAACVIGSLTGIIPGGDTKTLQLAQQRIEPTQPAPEPAAVEPASPLMVALNNPVVEIPKAAVTSPTKPTHHQKPKQGDWQNNIN
ncbi:zf-HC2 domain-containing protein [Tolypothrix sp. FACHB-123]|uniref:anti-sigma factor family protein n=1 Tax=Tolypothrix sp. FACHB-123 TaxID=2692868 RepID=UPI001689AD2F|nr:zf-HC2 domain-containing protein [Tolypothrix sp. FACHB-123]MBD2353973.1 zf-HC2 domain-containing protein [Tolypothrix sp. FACHB-123]